MDPILVINFDVEDNNFDINCTPDKREIFLKNESDIIDGLRVYLNQFFEDIQRISAYNVN
jgi:DNA mismatch repair ATPase MutL